MKSYSHSEAFQKLKETKEDITGNLTSLQYLQTLDFFLWNALLPIQTGCPSLFNNYLCKIAAKQSLKAPIKFTSDVKENLPVHLFNAITEEDSQKAHKHTRNMSLNRGLLFGFLSLFLTNLRYYEYLQSLECSVNSVLRKSEISRVELQFGVKRNSSLYAIIQQVRYWYERARSFKEKIIQKYTRMAIMQAQIAYKDFNCYVSLDDCVQIYLMVVGKSIDRCDSKHGVLTTFIQVWFKSARSKIAKMANSQSDQSIESLQEDYGDALAEMLGWTMQDTSSETIEHIAYVAKQEDPQGYIRAYLGIPEFVSRNHRNILTKFSLDVDHGL